MRPGDMEQMDEPWHAEHDRMWRDMLRIGFGLLMMLFASMLMGVGLGFLIWGI
jgi:hypothetical protein